MIDKNNLIEEINRTCRIFFVDSTFILHPNSVNRFKISGSNSSKAINNNKNSREEINVIKWFDNFWAYLDIRFENNNTFISLSIFQGEENDIVKNQLFRAEWDDYNSFDERHPQPHWHITSNQAIENTFKEYAEIDENDGFVATLNEEKSKIIDVNKIHFAMNGNWANNENHIHSISDNDKIINWFQGLFSHLKEELKYVSK